MIKNYAETLIEKPAIPPETEKPSSETTIPQVEKPAQATSKLEAEKPVQEPNLSEEDTSPSVTATQESAKIETSLDAPLDTSEEIPSSVDESTESEGSI